VACTPAPTMNVTRSTGDGHAPGHAAESIANFAQTLKPDLIVMGTHGHSALGQRRAGLGGHRGAGALQGAGASDTLGRPLMGGSGLETSP